MEKFTKPSIVRVARKAGIKNLSDDCYDTIRDMVSIKLKEVLSAAVITNDVRGTKTLMANDVVNSLRLQGVYISRSSDLNDQTCAKN
jgi:histone H3/H4